MDRLVQEHCRKDDLVSATQFVLLSLKEIISAGVIMIMIIYHSYKCITG